MSNDCGWGPMSLILSAVLTMTYLLKFAAMRYLADSRHCLVFLRSRERDQSLRWDRASAL